jgi:DNA-binding NarL/FixJ family response regulator
MFVELSPEIQATRVCSMQFSDRSREIASCAKKQRDIAELRLVVCGMLNKQIAAELGISIVRI